MSPVFTLGMSRQVRGRGWVACRGSDDLGGMQLGIALTMHGIGASLCWPTIANSVMGSVPPQEAGPASGTNSSLRELGGGFGVAILAAIFTRHGVYSSPPTFVGRFQPAPPVGAGLTAVRGNPPVPRPGRPGPRDTRAP